jgi:hypothetical protein
LPPNAAWRTLAGERFASSRLGPMQIWAMLQGAAEYGALAGAQAGSGGPRFRGWQQLSSWVLAHQVVAFAVLGGVVLLLLVKAARRP